MIMTIPAAAFRNGDNYPFTLTFTNSDNTFDTMLDINFVPVSCRWYKIQNSDTYSTFVNYLFDPASKDISFTLSYTETVSYCTASTFYNQLVQNVTYQILPPVAVIPALTLDYTDPKNIAVTIPRSEQYKFSTHINYTIIFSI